MAQNQISNDSQPIETEEPKDNWMWLKRLFAGVVCGFSVMAMAVSFTKDVSTAVILGIVAFFIGIFTGVYLH